MDAELEAEMAGDQGALRLGSSTYDNTCSGGDSLSPYSFQGYGLLTCWLDEPFLVFDYDSSHSYYIPNDQPNFENIESPSLSNFDEWYPTPSTNEPNDSTDLTYLTTFPFTHNSTSDTASQSWFCSIGSVSVFGESSASSSSVTQSTETEMTPFPPCSPDVSTPKEESLASQRGYQPKAMTKKRRRNRPCDLRREMKKVERPEKCPVPGCRYEGAAERRGLNRHLIAKHKDTAISQGLLVDKIKCKYFPSCGRTFSRKDHLVRHLKNKHGGG